jgi:hypothetical protein
VLTSAVEGIDARIDRFTAEGRDLSSSFSATFAAAHSTFVNDIAIQQIAVRRKEEQKM